MIFVDSGAWAALVVPDDPLHGTAAEWIRGNHELLATSDYVIDEVPTLVKARHSVRLAIQAGDALWGEDLSPVVFLSAADTDCTSQALMTRLGIAEAFSFDRHFSQMRGIRRVP